MASGFGLKPWRHDVGLAFPAPEQRWVVAYVHASSRRPCVGHLCNHPRLRKQQEGRNDIDDRQRPNVGHSLGRDLADDGCSNSPQPSITATTAAGAGALSGNWSGSYSGSSSGTFTLTWQQSGSILAGTINISEVGSPVPITGAVAGNSIHFGTVGTGAVTYTGTVSGSSMSGTWQGGNSTNGTWKATKS
jgi:hypothetical protein